MLWEAMIGEMRATRLELDNQRHFTKEKEPIETARAFVARWTVGTEAPSEEVVVAKTARNLKAVADQGLIEVG